ncbi:carbohydrate-binding module family 50 protein [Plenodomus tracheiphilus IPT5]|uniref:Carbohydrate-binding module family 50 protein n=1 Tax=Plenodomus tracheiphilus IPT5 TaxID=1408161 RepID=A0A6A7AN81_9PLEO|nr:carbohydrate-binding module family 50 protein [Plenodomus tracheiphilus IPT5]
MRAEFVLALASCLSTSTALRRGCKHNPSNYGEGWYYTQSFDNINNIAADFCTSPDVLKKWNNNKSGTITAGMNVKVPCRTRKRDCKKNSANDGAYVVSAKNKDDLTVIADDFCTDPDTLVRMNSGLIKNKDYIKDGWVIQDGPEVVSSRKVPEYLVTEVPMSPTVEEDMGDGLSPLPTPTSRAVDSWHTSAEEEVVEPDLLCP